MRTDGYENLSMSDDEGGVEGYVVDATAVNVANWLADQVEPWSASALLAGLRDQPGARVAVLRNLWVEEDAQGQGQGRFWLDDFLERADATVVLLVADVLQTQRDGFVLPRFYEAAGFAPVTGTGAGPMMAFPVAQAVALRERVLLAQAAHPESHPSTTPGLPSGRPGR